MTAMNVDQFESDLFSSAQARNHFAGSRLKIIDEEDDNEDDDQHKLEQDDYFNHNLSTDSREHSILSSPPEDSAQFPDTSQVSQLKRNIFSRLFGVYRENNHNNKNKAMSSGDQSDGGSHYEQLPWSINTTESETIPDNRIEPEQEPQLGSDQDEDSLLPESKEILQRRLLFFWMSPVDKWRAKRRLPLKLLFQLFKIIAVTVQLINFGNDMSQYMQQDENMDSAFRNQLLLGWEATREIVSYPPAVGPYSVYTSEEFFRTLDHSIRQYSNFTRQSVGLFGYPKRPEVEREPSHQSNSRSTAHPSLIDLPPIYLEKKYYSGSTIDPSSYHFSVDPNLIRVDRLEIVDLFPAGDQRWFNDFKSFDYFECHNFSLSFRSLITFSVTFPLRTVYFSDDFIRCYDMNVTILYDNSQHDARIPIHLLTNKKVHPCNRSELEQQLNRTNLNVDAKSHHAGFLAPLSVKSFSLNRFSLGISVIVFCILSSCLCIRSLYRGQLLRIETEHYFRVRLSYTLTLSERMEFVDLWLVMICLNDIFIISGTLMKIVLESPELINSVHFSACSLFLGVGNLLVWLGLLRYLSYFESYNILMVTLKRSIPNILRFLFCASLIYGGFCFCGWVVLGPYHLKFRTLSRTSECLFSLMNGDDMFATFFITDTPANSTLIWWFSRIYFYLFISLSIYVMVSLFIAIISESYDTVRELYKLKNGEIDELKTPLQQFIADYPFDCFDGRPFHTNSIVDHFHRLLLILFPVRPNSRPSNAQPPPSTRPDPNIAHLT